MKSEDPSEEAVVLPGFQSSSTPRCAKISSISPSDLPAPQKTSNKKLSSLLSRVYTILKPSDESISGATAVSSLREVEQAIVNSKYPSPALHTPLINLYSSKQSPKTPIADANDSITSRRQPAFSPYSARSINKRKTAEMSVQTDESFLSDRSSGNISILGINTLEKSTGPARGGYLETLHKRKAEAAVFERVLEPPRAETKTFPRKGLQSISMYGSDSDSDSEPQSSKVDDGSIVLIGNTSEKRAPLNEGPKLMTINETKLNNYPGTIYQGVGHTSATIGAPISIPQMTGHQSHTDHTVVYPGKYHKFESGFQIHPMPPTQHASPTTVSSVNIGKIKASGKLSEPSEKALGSPMTPEFVNYGGEVPLKANKKRKGSTFTPAFYESSYHFDPVPAANLPNLKNTKAETAFIANSEFELGINSSTRSAKRPKKSKLPKTAPPVTRESSTSAPGSIPNNVGVSRANSLTSVPTNPNSPMASVVPHNGLMYVRTPQDSQSQKLTRYTGQLKIQYLGNPHQPLVSTQMSAPNGLSYTSSNSSSIPYNQYQHIIGVPVYQSPNLISTYTLQQILQHNQQLTGLYYAGSNIPQSQGPVTVQQSPAIQYPVPVSVQPDGTIQGEHQNSASPSYPTSNKISEVRAPAIVDPNRALDSPRVVDKKDIRQKDVKSKEAKLKEPKLKDPKHKKSSNTDSLGSKSIGPSREFEVILSTNGPPSAVPRDQTFTFHVSDSPSRRINTKLTPANFASNLNSKHEASLRKSDPKKVYNPPKAVPDEIITMNVKGYGSNGATDPILENPALAEPPRRKRGRPRKEDKYRKQLASGPISTKDPQPVPAAPVVKRKRGRPRKIRDENEEIIKPRATPKKPPVIDNLSEDTSDSSLEAEAEEPDFEPDLEEDEEEDDEAMEDDEDDDFGDEGYFMGVLDPKPRRKRMDASPKQKRESATSTPRRNANLNNVSAEKINPQKLDFNETTTATAESTQETLNSQETQNGLAIRSIPKIQTIPNNQTVPSMLKERLQHEAMKILALQNATSDPVDVKTAIESNPQQIKSTPTEDSDNSDYDSDQLNNNEILSRLPPRFLRGKQGTEKEPLREAVQEVMREVVQGSQSNSESWDTSE